MWIVPDRRIDRVIREQGLADEGLTLGQQDRHEAEPGAQTVQVTLVTSRAVRRRAGHVTSSAGW